MSNTASNAYFNHKYSQPENIRISGSNLKQNTEQNQDLLPLTLLGVPSSVNFQKYPELSLERTADLYYR